MANSSIASSSLPSTQSAPLSPIHSILDRACVSLSHHTPLLNELRTLSIKYHSPSPSESKSKSKSSSPTPPTLQSHVFSPLRVHLLYVLTIDKRVDSDASIDRLFTFLRSLVKAFTDSKGRDHPNEGNVDVTTNSFRIPIEMVEKFHSFFNDLLNELCEFVIQGGRTARLRALQVVGAIVNSMDEDAEINEELFHRLRASLLLRTKDKIPSIRIESLKAMQRFQGAEGQKAMEGDDGQPMTITDPVTAEYVTLMGCDPVSDVRLVCLDLLDLSSPIVLEASLMRIRDENATIRMKTFEKLKDHRKHFKLLEMHQRVTIMKSGLREREKKVKRACVELLKYNWLDIRCKNDVERLMRELGMQTFTAECEIVATAMMEEGMLNDYVKKWKKIDKDTLTPEKAFIWRILIQHSREKKKAGGAAASAHLMKNVELPDIIDFLPLLNHFKGDPFILLQLLHLCQWSDFTDEIGRRELNTWIVDFLTGGRYATPKAVEMSSSAATTSVSTSGDTQSSPSSLYELEMLPLLMKLLRLLHIECHQDVSSNSSDNFAIGEKYFVIQITELLSEIRDPIEGEIKQHGERVETEMEILRVKLAHLQNGPKQGSQDEKTAKKIDILEKEMSTLTNELKVVDDRRDHQWLRLLIIVSELLSLTQRSNLSNPAIQGLLFSTIIPSLNLQSPRCREYGLKCLGLYLLMDAKAAAQYFPLMMEAAHHKDVNVPTTPSETTCTATEDMNTTTSTAALANAIANGDANSTESPIVSLPTINEFPDDVNEMLSIVLTELPIKLVALRSLVDASMVYRSTLDVDNQQRLIRLLLLNLSDNLIASLNPSPTTVDEENLMQIVSVSVEAFCKLLIYRLIPADPNVFQRLLFIFFNSQYENLVMIQQVLSVFFHVIYSSPLLRDGRALSSFIRSQLDVLHTVHSAVEGDPSVGEQYNLSRMMEFLIDMNGKNEEGAITALEMVAKILADGGDIVEGEHKERGALSKGSKEKSKSINKNWVKILSEMAERLSSVKSSSSPSELNRIEHISSMLCACQVTFILNVGTQKALKAAIENINGLALKLTEKSKSGDQKDTNSPLVAVDQNKLAETSTVVAKDDTTKGKRGGRQRQKPKVAKETSNEKENIQL